MSNAKLSAGRLSERNFAVLLCAVAFIALLCVKSSAQEGDTSPAIDRAAFRDLVGQLERDEQRSQLYHYRVTPDLRMPTPQELTRLRQALQDEARHRRSGNFDGAARDRRRAMETLEATYGPEHPVAAASAYRLGEYAGRVGRLIEAEGYLRQAVSISETSLVRQRAANAADAKVFVASIVDGLAENLTLLGRDNEAAPLFVRALSLREDALGVGNRNTSGTLGKLAMTLDRLGRHVEAEPLHRRALAIRETNHMLEAAANSRVHLGRNLLMQAKYVEAAEMLRAARDAGDIVDRAWTLTSLAAVHEAQGQEAAAEALLREARELYGAELDVAEPALHLANFLALRGRFEEAETHSRPAVAAYQRAYGPDSPFTGWALQVHALSQFGLESAEARNTARQSFAFYARQSVRSRAGRAPVLGWQAPNDLSASMTLQTAVRAGGNEGVAEAFVAAQALGDAAASDAMADGAARVAADEVGLGEAVRAWRDAIARSEGLSRQLAEAAEAGSEGDARRRNILVDLERANAARDVQERDLRRQFPRFFDLIAGTTTPLAEAQSILRPDEVLLLLTEGDFRLPEGHRRGVVFAVTRERVAWADVALDTEQLAAEIAALHGQLSAGGATRAPGLGNAGVASGARGFDRARAHRLYRALFATPAVAELVDSKPRWILAPQGVLLSAPFAALVSSPPSGGATADADPGALRGTRWLGLERALSIMPSISALREQRRSPPDGSNESQVAFFGIGDPAFDGAPGPARGFVMHEFFRDRAGNADAVRALPRLQGTRIEIEQLARAFGAAREDYLLDVAASEAELARRGTQLARADVIAFATHGLMAGDLEGSLAEQALALTPPSHPSDIYDGLLTASEAARLRLRARWVILSACNTAAGGQPDAEGLTGLARGFFYAGARTLLVSQWSVNDEAAQRLTTRAVELQRSENLLAPEAMRRSMVQLMLDANRDLAGHSFSHPSAWAPFVLVSGD